MNSRTKKILLVLLAAVLLFASGQVQNSLNVDRDRLGLTRVAALENAPPMLAFTTVALGGFRGLISNLLWMRANDLQQDDKFFEAVQLANWITELEPHFSQVWVFLGWNMAYNISVKFTDFPDRWRWVDRGIILLRDKGLVYNPDDILIYRELGWFFQHKMGQDLDDANNYYKQQWAYAMKPYFGVNGTNFDALINPKTPEEVQRLHQFTNEFKIDPVFAKQVDDKYGPLDWRLPEAHAIYWGARGLDAAARHPDKVKKDDIIMVRRIIYQSIFQAFHHGRLISNPFQETYSMGPNLELVSRVNAAYETNMLAEPQMADHIGNAHRNFLRDAVYFLYENNRMTEAAKWFKYLGDKYPNKTIIENDTNSYPRNETLDDFAVATVQIDVNETSRERVTSAIEGLLSRSYFELAIGQDGRYYGFQRLAEQVYDRFNKKTNKVRGDVRVALPKFQIMSRDVLNQLLDPVKGVPYAERAALRTALGMPAESRASAVTSTNAPPDISTNALETTATNTATLQQIH